MATFTVSGTGTLPDNTTPLRGTWTIAIQTSNGVAFDGDGSWRGGVQSFDTGTDGSLTVTLPETDGDFLYVAAFKSRDLKTRIGPYAFDLTANTTWQHIIETPTLVPITPALVDLVQGLADDVEAAAAQVATDRAAVQEDLDALPAEIDGGVSAAVGTQVPPAVATAVAAAGVLNAASAPTLQYNRVPDPQMVTAGASTNAPAYVLTRITTGLPAGLPTGLGKALKTVRASTLSGTISSVTVGPSSSTDPLRVPVVPGEVGIGSIHHWTDQANAGSRLNVTFKTSAGATVGSAITGTFNTIAQNTVARRQTAPLVVPATAAYVQVDSVISMASGNTVTGAIGIHAGFQWDVDTLKPYGDGTMTSLGWSFLGTANASASKKVQLALGDFETPTGAAAQIAAYAAGLASVTLVKSGSIYTVTSLLDTQTIATRTSRYGSSNGALALQNTTLDGVQLHSHSDDIAPISTVGQVGGNHGYGRCVAYTHVGHAKTTADLGSIYTQGGRFFTLVSIVGNDLTFLVDYAVSGGVTTVASATPTGPLVHSSGGTHTADVPITTPIAGPQLWPSVKDVTVEYLIDGRLVPETDGTYVGTTATIRDSWSILDYKALVDWCQSHIGQSYTANLSAIDASLRVVTTYTYRAGNSCVVSQTLKALKKLTFGSTGVVQSAAMTGSGMTLKRYVPDVKPKGGYDLKSAPLDMSTYVGTQTYGLTDLIDPTKPPDRIVDWLYTGSTKVLGFALGYIPDKTSASDAARLAGGSTDFLLETLKNYPTALQTRTVNPGDYLSFEAYRHYLSPAKVGVATNVSVVEDSASVYVFLDYHTAAAAVSIPLSANLIGRPVTVVRAVGITLLNDVVDAEGVTITSASYGTACLRIDR